MTITNADLLERIVDVSNRVADRATTQAIVGGLYETHTGAAYVSGHYSPEGNRPQTMMVRSPTAASEYSSSKNLGLAERQLAGNRFGSFGSGAEIESSKFIAVKLPLGFRSPEGGIRQ